MKAKLFDIVHKYSVLFEFLLVFIITVPAFLSLLNNGYFTMHDDQHIARLFLFDTALKQGQWYPRWVDWLGFGYGYPMFNFYPPFIYFIAQLFHVVGFSFIWSIKMMLITGFILAAWGMYLLLKYLTDRISALVGATLYTYFFYHAVTIYVRGAFAEFFALAILPFLFLTIIKLGETLRFKDSVLFGIFFAILITTHQISALASTLFISFFFVFFLVKQKNAANRVRLFGLFLMGGMLGVGLSAFFWMPAIFEKQYTFVDTINTGELFNYKLHFIYPIQFFYSMWGYGGSTAGLADGITFQLGKVHMAMVLISVVMLSMSLFMLKKYKISISTPLFMLSMLLFSLFMTISASTFIWEIVPMLSFLQFPWRFLTFVCFFISIVGAYGIYYMKYIPFRIPHINTIQVVSAVLVIFVTIGIYRKYFVPQQTLATTDRERTSYEEIAWRVSSTWFEFVPDNVRTKKSQFNTTIIDVSRETIARSQYELNGGTAEVTQTEDLFHRQKFSINAQNPVSFRLNTFYFPGWKAYIMQGDERKELTINANNDFKLSTVQLPAGNFNLVFEFTNTPVRTASNIISIASIMISAILLSPIRKRFVK